MGGSREIDDMFDFMEAMINIDRNDPYGSILKLIKADPYYQEQCANDSTNSTVNPSSPPAPITKTQSPVFKEDYATCDNRLKAKHTTCINQCLQNGNSGIDACTNSYPTDIVNHTICGENVMAVSESCMDNCTQQYNIQSQKCL